MMPEVEIKVKILELLIKDNPILSTKDLVETAQKLYEWVTEDKITLT